MPRDASHDCQPSGMLAWQVPLLVLQGDAIADVSHASLFPCCCDASTHVLYICLLLPCSLLEISATFCAWPDHTAHGTIHTAPLLNPCVAQVMGDGRKYVVSLKTAACRDGDFFQVGV